MIGTGSNANVHSVVVIGIEPDWTKRIADGIRETGKEVAEFSIEQKGDFETIRAASWAQLAALIVSKSPFCSIENSATSLPVSRIPSAIRFVQSGSIPITTTE